MENRNFSYSNDFDNLGFCHKNDEEIYCDLMELMKNRKESEKVTNIEESFQKDRRVDRKYIEVKHFI